MKLCPRCREPYADDAAFCPLDGVELVRDADPFVGRTLAARYRLLRRIGAGGMAVVYLARHVMIDRLSAIKILRQDLVMNPAHRERFYREARAVNRINHPNIVEITDFGEDGGLVFLVMEYVEGESLLSVLRRGRLPWRRASAVAMQVASALARAHELGVIHRDLKPENVLLVAHDPGEVGQRVKLTDFGIAKVVNAPTITFSEQRLGTPGFIAPEYIEGATPGPLCDLYALGVVLYEMLTGELPFDSVQPVELLAMTLTGERIRPSARVGGLPAELEDLVMRMIARKPEDRPRDAFAVHDALAAVLQRPGRASTMPPPGAPSDSEAPAAPRPPAGAAPLEAREATGPESSRAQEEPDDEDAPLTVRADPPDLEVPSSRSRSTFELAALPTGEIAARWHGMLEEMARQVDDARAARGDDDGSVRRGSQLADHARGLVASLDRVKALAAEHQARVDELEAQGRTFRGSLGNAIDTLSRDRSRERARLAAIASRRRGLDEAKRAIGPDSGERDALLWENAALEADGARADAVEQDLGYQIGQLQGQLDAQNERLEGDLAEASGHLEGALSALRRLTGELVRTLEEGTRVLT